MSIRIFTLPIHDQIFHRVKLSTQYNSTFRCDITSEFIKKAFLLQGYVWGVHVCYLKFDFVCVCVSTVTEIIRPALLEYFNSILKFLESSQIIAIELLVLFSDEKRACLIQYFSRKWLLQQYYVFPVEVLCRP